MRKWQCRFVGGQHDGETKELTGTGTFPENFQFDDGEEYSPITQSHSDVSGGHCIMRHSTASDEAVQEAIASFMT